MISELKSTTDYSSNIHNFVQINTKVTRQDMDKHRKRYPKMYFKVKAVLKIQTSRKIIK